MILVILHDGVFLQGHIGHRLFWTSKPSHGHSPSNVGFAPSGREKNFVLIDILRLIRMCGISESVGDLLRKSHGA